jgi:alkylmercury lyase
VATSKKKEGLEVVSLEETAEAIRAALPNLDGTDQRIAITIHRLIGDGKPATSEAVAKAVDVPVSRVEQSLNSWPGVYRDDEGRVIGFWGQGVDPLDPEYRLKSADQTTYAWCALDTLFIPTFLGKTVTVESTDPVTGDQVSLVVDGKGVRDVKPAGAVVSMVVPDGPFGYDVIESFCHRVLFFASEETGKKWTSGHEGTTLVSVPEAFMLGQALAEKVAPDLFGPNAGRQA